MDKDKTNSVSFQVGIALFNLSVKRLSSPSDDELWACILLALYRHAFLQMYILCHEALKACFCPVCN